MSPFLWRNMQIKVLKTTSSTLLYFMFFKQDIHLIWGVLQGVEVSRTPGVWSVRHLRVVGPVSSKASCGMPIDWPQVRRMAVAILALWMSSRHHVEMDLPKLQSEGSIPLKKSQLFNLLPAPSMWKERLKIQRKAQNEAPMNLGTGSYLKHTSHKW